MPVQLGRTRTLSLGIVIPTVLVAAVLFDLVVRFLAPELLIRSASVRAAMRAPWDAPFGRSLVLTEAARRGDLAVGAIAPEHLVGPLVFSTDGLGFRRTRGATVETADTVIAFGRSFIWGAALNDDQTLPQVLTSRHGIRAYNAGRFVDDPDDLHTLERLLTRFRAPRRIVLVQLERSNLTSSAGPITRAWGRLRLPRDWLDSARMHHRFAKRWLGTRLAGSPLRAASIRLLRGDATSTTWHGPVRELTLAGNGRRFLVRREEVEHVLAPPDDAAVEETAAVLAEYAGVLRARGLDVFVLLLPDKFTVYEPLLVDAPLHDAGAYLRRLRRALELRGVQTIDPLPALRRAAADGEVYYRDDTHWTERGVQVVAGEVAAAISGGRESVRALQ